MNLNQVILYSLAIVLLGSVFSVRQASSQTQRPHVSYTETDADFESVYSESTVRAIIGSLDRNSENEHDERSTNEGMASNGGSTPLVFNGPPHFQLRQELKIQSLGILDKVQSKLTNKGLVCMPGSIPYNGSCIYFSHRKEKLSWLHAERFCRRLPLNSSLLMIQNDHQYETVREALVQLRNKEQPQDQLVFYVGFRHKDYVWSWNNNQTLDDSNLTLSEYWSDWDGSHGDCGSLALLRNNKLIMRSTPCMSTSGRFICQYVLNPCFQNDACGKNGRCINLYTKFVCDCSDSIFFEGKYCNEFSSNTIQAIIGLIIVAVITFVLFVGAPISVWLYARLFSEKPKEEIDEMKVNPRLKLKPAHIIDAKGSELYDKTLINIENARYNDQEIKKIYEFKKIYDKKFKKKRFGDGMAQMLQKFGHNVVVKFLGNATVYERLLSALVFLLLVILQVVFIHKVVNVEMFDKIRNVRKEYEFLGKTCNFLEGPYMSEEIIILPFSLLMYSALWLFYRPKRFSKRIMIKFNVYFHSTTYKRIWETRKKEWKAEKNRRFDTIKGSKMTECGIACQKWYYSDHKFLRRTKEFFCALFCCSCCVPPASSTRCCCLYICCLGWHQTDCYKVFSKIRDFFKILCCCCIWKRICGCIKANRAKKKEQKRNERLKRINDFLKINEVEDEVNEDEFHFDQTFYNPACPLPASPFSTTNRAQSAAIYVAFAYDIVNIFASLYTKITHLPFTKLLGQQTEGVLFMICYQVIHVFVVGIKYYPILIITDIDASTRFYFGSFLYILIIFTIRFVNKSFCARTEAFIKLFYTQITEQYGDAFKTYWQNRYNMSNRVLAMFTDEDDSNKKYMSDLKNKVPKLFKRIFGRYESDPDGNPGSFEMQTKAPDFDSLLADESPMQEIFLTSTVTSEDYFASTPQMFYNQMNETAGSSFGFRERVRNKTSEKFDKVLGFFGTRDKSSELLFEVLENLPLYITLAYLLSRYSLIFMEKLISRMKCLATFKRKKNAAQSSKKEKTAKTKKSQKDENVNDSVDTATTNSYDENSPNSDQTLNESNKYFQDSRTDTYADQAPSGSENEEATDTEIQEKAKEIPKPALPKKRVRLSDRVKEKSRLYDRHLHPEDYNSDMDRLDMILKQGGGTSVQIMKHMKELQDIIRRMSDPVKEEKYIREGHVHIGENHNYLYIKELLAYQRFYDDPGDKSPTHVVIRLPDDVGEMGHSKIQPAIPNRAHPISTLSQVKLGIGKLFSRFYTYVPHMKYSKQFVNTYVVAFMLLFFFTMFGLRLSNLFGNSVILVFSTLYRFLLKGILPSIDWAQYDFMYEFRVASVLSAVVISVQLLLSISNFHNELKELHMGKSRLLRVDYGTYNPKLEKEKRKASITITSDSLHFPGYLIAHIVYGYVIFFLIAFVVAFIFRIIFMAPGLSSRLFINYLLPIFVMVSIKVVVFKFLTRFYFLAGDGQRMTNPTPYHVSSYFNFFLDCFLGLVACLSRIWETTIVSIILLPRLDKSIFNDSQETLMKRLDKGHVAYLNYLRMEHWYNNPVLNGFCEMIIESMFHSQVYRELLEQYSGSTITAETISKEEALRNAPKIIEAPYHAPEPQARLITSQPAKSELQRMVSFNLDDENQEEDNNEKEQRPQYIRLTHSVSMTPSVGDHNVRNTLQKIYVRSDSKMETNIICQTLAKRPNPDFKFKSYLRLRNVFYLCLLLQKNPGLKNYRYHCIKQKIEEQRLREEREKMPDIWDRIFFKMKKATRARHHSE